MGRAPRKEANVKRFIQAVVVTATVLAAVVVGGTAYANSNANGSISVTPSTTTTGGTVHISGSVDVQGCPQSDDATITGPSALFPPDGFGPDVSRDANG